MSAPERVFLGWRAPVLPRLAAWMLDHFGPNLSDVLAVVPGRRAGRLLLARLVGEAERTEAEGSGFVPPRIATPGSLPECFYRPPRRLAGELERLVAWCAVLAGSDARLVAGAASQEGDTARRVPLARELCRVQQELGRQGLFLADVAAHAERIGAAAELERWRALAQLERCWRERLEARGCLDPTAARLAARDRLQGERRWSVVLCNLPAMGALERELLHRGAREVTALVAAPQEEKALFDAWGGVDAKAWQDRRLALAASALDIEERPRDQAVAAARRVAAESAQGRVTLGLAEPALVAAAEAELRRRGVGFHSALGRELRRTAPWLLLSGVADYLETRTFAALACLLRHPDWEQILGPVLTLESARSGVRAEGEVGRAIENGDWLSVLDLYTSETLLATVGEQWPGQPAAARLVARMQAELLQALGLRGAEELGSRAPLGTWAGRIRNFLLRVYGDRRLDPSRRDGRPLHRLGELLDELQDGGEESPCMRLGEALTLLLAQGAGEKVAVEGGGGVEIVGWLELVFDDAETIVVAGMNEGAVPAPLAAETSLLTRPLRRSLGLEQDEDRYARDLFALENLARSRRLRLIAGRRGGNGESLVPSRLLLACSDRELADRLLLFFGGVVGPRPSRQEARAGRLEAVRPGAGAGTLDRLPVTAFRDYLACPYRFWLVHCRGLRTMRDLPREMSPATFGGLLHRALGLFARQEKAASDGDAIFRMLADLVERLAVESFGSKPRVAVRVQIEQARRRLEAFSHWQAAQLREGWRPVPAWAEARIEAVLEVDGEPLRLTGRIDRLDRHPSKGWRLIDYKSAESARAPEESHREGRGRRRRWVDLQLPLYDFMLRQNGVGDDIELAFVNLGPHLGRDLLAPAGWTSEELAEALAVAKGVVRDVRAGRFWPPAPPPRHADGLEGLVGDRLRRRDTFWGGGET